MPLFLRSLPALVLATGLVAILPQRSLAVDPPDLITQAKTMANGMAKALRVLREDIDIDLPDARGEALGAIVDRSVLEVRQLQRATRTGVAPAQLHKMTVELDKELDRLVAAASPIGTDAYYLRKSAARINAQNEMLARLLAPATIPPRVFVLIHQITKSLAALGDDIDIDLPDARGKGLDGIVDQARVHLRPIHRGAHFGASPAELRGQVIELNKDLQRLANAADAIGTDAYYIRKSAVRIHALGLELLKALGS